MSYYKGNAVYDELIKNSVNHLKFVTGNEWQLIYGDANCDPKLLVYVFGKNESEYNSNLSNADQEGVDFYKHLSAITGVPYILIKFRTDISEVTEVLLSTDGTNFELKNMMELMQVFSSYNLPISNSTTGKYLNDRTSSAYHKWQRGSLGSSLKVSDIDLYKVGANGNPTTIYELKRSYYSLDRWAPFRDDYNNFRLLSKLCNSAGTTFKILYNVRHKSPFFDDASKLKLFSVNFNNTPPIELDGIVDFQDFIK
nr:hypothetical protein [uncultured Psychroserpens sp.]